MAQFERNDAALTEKIIDEQVEHPKVGIVTKVYEHAAEDDDSNWEIDVELNGGTAEEKRVPVHTPGNDVITPPKVRDKILILYRQGVGNTPVAFGTGYSNKDRPPLGRAGMYRNRFKSGTSPAGDGDLYLTGYTKYDDTPAANDKRDLTPETTMIQLTKHAIDDNDDPSSPDADVPAKIELYDSPKNDESWISVEINQENGSSSDATWGIKFNIKSGEWKLVGPSGFGIESDGSGNFVWHHASIDFNEVSGTGPLSL